MLLANETRLSQHCVPHHVLRITFHFLCLDTSVQQQPPPPDSPAVRPSPSRSSSQPTQQIRQTGSWWQTPPAWARGRWLCSTWRQCCVSPTSGESPRRGHGVYSRCCWLVQKLQEDRGERLGNNTVGVKSGRVNLRTTVSSRVHCKVCRVML